MKILFVLQEFPYPPTGGIKWKMYNLLAYMARRHECHILGFGDLSAENGTKEWIKALGGLRIMNIFPQSSGLKLRMRQIKRICLGDPISLARWESPALRATIRELSNMNNYDIVHYDVINMAQYRPLVADIPGVLSINDAMGMRYRKLARITKNPIRKVVSLYKAYKLSAFEKQVINEFSAIHVVSQVDAEYLAAHNPKADNIELITLCADPSFLEIPVEQTDLEDLDVRKAVLFTSGYLREAHIAEPIINFIKTSFKQIRSVWPNVELFVVGHGAPKEVVRTLNTEPGVRYAPWIEHYIDAIKASDIAVFLDSTGSGMKTRVIHALAAGKPVIGTPAVFDGIRIENGFSAFLCRSLDDVAKTAILLLKDRSLRHRTGLRGRQLILRYYSQSAIGEQWEALYSRAIDRFYSNRKDKFHNAH
jgi:glycosyltransferase involved in cell wall biosynthesis